jgi:hypothetical protein
MNPAKILAVLEGLGLSANDLLNLSHLMRERERERAEQRVADLAELMWDRPTIGAIRRQEEEEEP